MSAEGVIMSPPKAAGGVIRASVSIPGGTQPGTSLELDLKWNPDAAVSKMVVIPANEEWELKDLYTATQYGAEPVASAQVRIRKDADRILDYSEILASVYVGNPGRPNGLHANLTFAGASQMTMDLITGEAVAPSKEDDPTEYIKKQFELMEDMGIIPKEKEDRDAFKLDVQRELMKNIIANKNVGPQAPLPKTLVLIPYEKHSM